MDFVFLAGRQGLNVIKMEEEIDTFLIVLLIIMGVVMYVLTLILK